MSFASDLRIEFLNQHPILTSSGINYRLIFSFKKGTHQHNLGKIGHFAGFYSVFSTSNNCCYLGEETVD